MKNPFKRINTDFSIEQQYMRGTQDSNKTIRITFVRDFMESGIHELVRSHSKNRFNLKNYIYFLIKSLNPEYTYDLTNRSYYELSEQFYLAITGLGFWYEE